MNFDYNLSELEAFAYEDAEPVKENGVTVGYILPNGSIKYYDDEERED